MEVNPRLKWPGQQSFKQNKTIPRKAFGGSMDPLLQITLLTELDGQCNNARLALGLMRGSVAAAADPNATEEALRRFWFYAQGWLAAVANISKILYPAERPSRPERVASSNHLQGMLGAVTKPFDATSRQMRNNYEHFDERIDVNWWTSPNRGTRRADYNFHPLGDLEAQFGTVNCFRNYDARTETLTFMGQHFQIRPVEQAIIALQQQIAPHLT
jgi:hypothetical protein